MASRVVYVLDLVSQGIRRLPSSFADKKEDKNDGPSHWSISGYMSRGPTKIHRFALTALEGLSAALIKLLIKSKGVQRKQFQRE